MRTAVTRCWRYRGFVAKPRPRAWTRGRCFGKWLPGRAWPTNTAWVPHATFCWRSVRHDERTGVPIPPFNLNPGVPRSAVRQSVFAIRSCTPPSNTGSCPGWTRCPRRWRGFLRPARIFHCQTWRNQRSCGSTFNWNSIWPKEIEVRKKKLRSRRKRSQRLRRRPAADPDGTSNGGRRGERLFAPGDPIGARLASACVQVRPLKPSRFARAHGLFRLPPSATALFRSVNYLVAAAPSRPRPAGIFSPKQNSQRPSDLRWPDPLDEGLLLFHRL